MRNMVNPNLICNIMALNSDFRCLRLSKKIYKNQSIFLLKLSKKLPIIMDAGIKGHIGIIKFLLKDIKINPIYLDVAFWNACKYGHIEIVKILLKDNRIDPSDGYAFIYACEYGHIEIVKILLKDNRSDLIARNNIAIAYASENGHRKVEKLLLKNDKISTKIKEMGYINWK